MSPGRAAGTDGQIHCASSSDPERPACARAEARAEDDGCLVVGALRLARVRRRPFEQLAPHVHCGPQVCIVESGCLREQVDGAATVYPAGGIVFRPSGATHHDLGSAEGALLTQIDLDARSERCLSGFAPARLPSYVSLDRFGDLARRLKEEWRRPSSAPLSLDAILVAAWTCISRRDVPTVPAHVARATELIDAAGPGPLSLSRLARATAVKPVRLAQDFKRFKGVTVHQYIGRRRVREAARLLAQSNSSISEVALSCGFCDQSHLTRSFKRHRGVTPAEFRRLHGR